MAANSKKNKGNAGQTARTKMKISYAPQKDGHALHIRNESPEIVGTSCTSQDFSEKKISSCSYLVLNKGKVKL